MTPLSTAEFWEKMCDFGFNRIDHHRGNIGKTIYFCSSPPEDYEEFMNNIYSNILKNLGVKKRKIKKESQGGSQ